MRRTLLIGAILALSLIDLRGCGGELAFAQTSEAPPKVAAPVLSATDSIALMALGEKMQANNKEGASLLQMLRAVEAEIVAAHPGYHLDEATSKLVKDAPKETPAKAAIPSK